MTIQGRSNVTTFGTYGYYGIGSQWLTLERLLATFFTKSGIYIAASVINNLNNCEASYCEEHGLFLDYQADYLAGSYNAYMTNVMGSRFAQNKDANIKLGTSTHGVNIVGCDIESAGGFYATGLGYGLHMTSEARGVNVLGNWFEGNKKHIVMGADDSVTTVPWGVRIHGNQFWSVTGGAEKIRINAGRKISIVGNNFQGGGSIYLGPRADNPFISENVGNPTVTNVNGDNIMFGDVGDGPNSFPEPDISTWALQNCTVAQEEITTPAGRIPVYKVTPTAPGLVAMTYAGAGLAPFTARHTFGFWIKRSVATEQVIGWQVGTSGGPTSYSDYATVDNETYSDAWKWVSFGREVPATDTGNFQLAIVTTVATADPFYISAMQAKPGIIYGPFREPDSGIATLANSATPSVWGLKTAVTGGVTGITNFTKGAVGQIFTLIAEHALTINDNANIVLAGSANFAMNPTDTLTLIRKADAKWYEIEAIRRAHRIVKEAVREVMREGDMSGEQTVDLQLAARRSRSAATT
jgi:hypothetical protein